MTMQLQAQGTPWRRYWLCLQEAIGNMKIISGLSQSCVCTMARWKVLNKSRMSMKDLNKRKECENPAVPIFETQHSADRVLLGRYLSYKCYFKGQYNKTLGIQGKALPTRIR